MKNKIAKKKVRSKKVKVSKKEGKKSSKNMPAVSMEELLKKTEEKIKIPKKGESIAGVVTEISRRMMLVDIGSKTEGMVVDKEYEAAVELIKQMQVGDKIKALVVSPENDRGQILLSLRKAAVEKSWDRFEELLNTGGVITVRGLETNKGGLIVRADGMRGFVPSSQFGKRLVEQIDSLVDRPVKVKVIEVDKEKNRLIFSEKHVSEAGEIEKKDEALTNIKPGDIYEGVVSGVMQFGAFVTVRVPIKAKAPKGKSKTEKAEVDGLVHISEISWEKVQDPNEYFKRGDKVKVKVISVDADGRKLNLSVKRMKDDPWEGIEKKYKTGSKHEGTVTRVEQFGAFVNFEPGVDGLIHISKIPAGEEPKMGEKIDVYVETLDPQQRRMSLSLVLKTTEKLIYK